jgi:N-acetylglucosaminyldiphosphoundecaprenol N-acetyl-beta-D-mannosaminyltransferase
VLGIGVSAASLEQHIAALTRWAQRRDVGRVVCVANAHMLVEARRDPAFATVLREADAVTPDGMPLVWMLRARGSRGQERVAGMDLIGALCAAAEEQNIAVYFVGSTRPVLDAIANRLRQEHPRLRIGGMEAPPFREATPAEDSALVDRIAESGAGLVLVALGCPKQENWMHAHRGKVRAVMVGLGAAFPIYGRLEPRAPLFMRRMGLEWLFRLLREPRRLWKRYALTNPLFVWYALQEALLQPPNSRELP